MKRTLTLFEKWEIIEREWARARARDPEVVLRVHVDEKTDETGNPRVCVVIALPVPEVPEAGNTASCGPLGIRLPDILKHREQGANEDHSH